jgi:D-alanyl-D-alanine carboxypeptidase/D-alanyl-D-alanine-endopeptidase (penicillin-binding protein 4)
VTNGWVSGKTLKGDIIIRGSGDPTLGSSLMFPNYEPTFVFQQWADSLSRRGIEKIDGSVIADDNYFTAELYPLGWSHEDISFGFAAPSSGICFAENSVSVSVSPNIRAGSRPFVAIIPETDYIEKTNYATTTREEQEPIEITRLPGTSTVVIRGTITPGSSATLEQISVEEPPIYAATSLRTVLEQNGITITGGTLGIDELREKVAYQKTRTLASFVSPPLSEIVKVMNKRSNNLYAEQLLRTIGKEVNGKGSWEEGLQLMEAKLASNGVSTEFLTINDGSGLSRLNLLTPATLGGGLRTAAKTPGGLSKAFIESLPIMGIDGTLETRLVGTPAQGNIKAKTGSMTGVRSLSGYATTKDGETLAFVLVANNFSGASKEVNNVHDLILLQLVNFSRK